jgi:hypothetical protein
MNWFERYGIVGMFFIAMTGMWFFCLFPESRELFNNSNPELAKYIVGFCGLSFLPFGYIIMVFSQVYHYKRNRIHCRYWRDLPDKIKDVIQNEEEKKGLGKLSEKDQNNEAKIEAILTYYDRKYFFPLETNKFISSFATKRFDVAAINNGLIWALIFSLIVAICIEGIILDVTIKWDTFSTWFVIILALLIICVLWLSERIVEGQIFEIGRRKSRAIDI